MSAPEPTNGDVATKDGSKTEEQSSGNSWIVVIGCVIGMFASLYVFLLGLQLLGDGFKCLGGRGAGGMFTAISNPIAGLMTGILATVLVQSSSTSTSIVVGLVGADQITVKTGIPIIMGANIGTSVTNTIVSMGFVGNRAELEAGFSGATVHDMFNFLTVLTLLPLELIIGAIQGEGGMLYWLTKGITDGIIGSDKAGELFPSPIKTITSPVAKLVISNNKYVISALSLGQPAAHTPVWTNSSACSNSTRRLAGEEESEELSGASEGGVRALLSRRMTSSGVDCSRYFCVSSELKKNFKKISESGYKKLKECDGYVTQDPHHECPDSCFINADTYFQSYVTEKAIIKGGFVQGAGDVGGGVITLIFALIMLTLGLFCLTKLLHKLFIGKAKKIIVMATRMNDYIALVIGIGITIVVQSSSVTTSALTPFCAMGLITLEKMLPLTLGANIGTTITALIAALTKMTSNTVHIALCHLFFNIIGILIWFPVPIMRRVPLGAARLLGLYASFYRAVPLVYILVCFVALPGIALGVSALYDASIAGGVILTLLLLGVLAGFEFWWIWMGGCYKVISKEDREMAANAAAADPEAEGEQKAGAPEASV